MGDEPRLIILLHCPVVAFDGRSLTVSAKFLQEIYEFARCWPGVVRLVAHEDAGWTSPFSVVTVEVGSLPFEVEVRPRDGFDQSLLAGGAAVVLSALGGPLDRVVEIGRGMNVPVVYVAEYTYDASRRMMELETTNPIRRIRRTAWFRTHLRQEQHVVGQAAGLQCNGTPAFEEHRGLNRRTILFFNGRVTDDLLAGADDQAARFERLRDRAHPLHLVYSGRFERMKGVDHLPDVARELRSLGVPFRMSICGGGNLAPEIVRRVEAEGLAGVVDVRPPMSFADELMPFVRREADLFVCCHPQGDPSSTYLETMACGVPYAGFANEALVGVAERSHAAWVSPIGDTRALANEIAALDAQREQLVHASAHALEFARQHTFPTTTARRVEHLRAVAGV